MNQENIPTHSVHNMYASRRFLRLFCPYLGLSCSSIARSLLLNCGYPSDIIIVCVHRSIPSLLLGNCSSTCQTHLESRSDRLREIRFHWLLSQVVLRMSTHLVTPILLWFEVSFALFHCRFCAITKRTTSCLNVLFAKSPFYTIHRQK